MYPSIAASAASTLFLVFFALSIPVYTVWKNARFSFIACGSTSRSASSRAPITSIRASDVAAYTNVGLAADRIFIELPEYAGEVQPLLDAHEALGFTTYDELRTTELVQLP